MKTKEEVQKMALERFPTEPFRAFSDDYSRKMYKLNKEFQSAFIEGYELAQQETLKLEKINAELISALESSIPYLFEYALNATREKAEQALANAKQSK